MSYPIKVKRHEEDSERASKMVAGKEFGRKDMGYKRGGAVKDDSDTNIHIEINAAPKPDAGPLASALSQASMPPPPPPAPDMGGAPPIPPPGLGGGMPPPMGGGPGPIAMRRGGRVKNRGAESSAHSTTDGDKIKPTHAPVPPPAKKSAGGGVRQLTNASGGAGGGLGRLKKAANER